MNDSVQLPNWIKFCKFEKHLKVSKYAYLLIEIIFQISK